MTVQDLLRDAPVMSPATVPIETLSQAAPTAQNKPIPQRWAINAWGETVWTYLVMWAPELLQQTSQRVQDQPMEPHGPPNDPAVMFHELGAALSRHKNAPPPIDEQSWRWHPEPEPTPLRLYSPDGPILFEPTRSRAPAAVPPVPLPPPMHYLAMPEPQDWRNILQQEWRAAAEAAADTLELISATTEPHLSLTPLLQNNKQSPFAEELPPPPDPTEAEIQTALSDNEEIRARLALLWDPLDPIAQWLTAVTAWHATLAIRYSPHEELSRPLRLELMSRLLKVPMPAQHLPLMLPEIPETVEMLPPVPEVLLDAYTGLLPEL